MTYETKMIMHTSKGSNKQVKVYLTVSHSSPSTGNVIEADVDPALFRAVTVYVIHPTDGTEGVPEIVHEVWDRVTPAGRAGETEHDVTAVPPVQVMMILVGDVILTLAAVPSGRLEYEQPLGDTTSEGIVMIMDR